TLLRIALENSGWVVPTDMLQGATAIAFTNGNVPGVMKALQAFIKDTPDKLVIRGGILEMKTVFSEKDIDAVASMPTMEEIRAQLAGLIVQPAAQLAGLLNSATAQVVNVIQAYLDKQNEGAAA
ncbi:MAG: 50S ribosomal protein L10, partial [Anaerolinea sp.]|nr:50S ribosomal protein L10 [Anaerolinea sp.]